MVPNSTAWTFRISWLVLALASFPIILDYIQHVLSHSWAWYAWVFPICVLLSVSRAKRRTPHIVPAISLITLGIVCEIFASASGMLSLGRPGFILAASGILLADGRLDLRRFVMLALAIPLPHALLEKIGPPFLFLNIEMLARMFQIMGVPALATLHGVEQPAGILMFKANDVGWTSAIFAFGLAWVLFERYGRPWLQTLIGSAFAAVVGLLIHLLCTTLIFAFIEPSAIANARIWRDILSYSMIGAAIGGYRALCLRAKPRS